MQNTAVNARHIKRDKKTQAYIYPGMQQPTPGFYYGTTAGVAPVANVFPGCQRSVTRGDTAYIYPGMN